MLRMQMPIVGKINSRSPVLVSPVFKQQLASHNLYPINRRYGIKVQKLGASEGDSHITSTSEVKKEEEKQQQQQQQSSTATAEVETDNETEAKEEDKSLIATTAVEEVEGMFAAKELWEEVKSGEELGKRGEAFFLGQLLIIFLIFFPPFEIKGLLAICSILLIISGLVSVWLSVFNLGTSISPFPVPRKNNHLVTNGIYGIVRHPMYAGVLMVCAGLTLFTGGETRLLLTLLLTYLFNSKAKMEEKYLLERYPEQYKEYMENSVKYRFLPLLY